MRGLRRSWRERCVCVCVCVCVFEFVCVGVCECWEGRSSVGEKVMGAFRPALALTPSLSSVSCSVMHSQIEEKRLSESSITPFKASSAPSSTRQTRDTRDRVPPATPEGDE
jgi:hypothetical protein